MEFYQSNRKVTRISSEHRKVKIARKKNQSWPGLPLYWKHLDLMEKAQRTAWIQCRGGETLKQGAGGGQLE